MTGSEPQKPAKKRWISEAARDELRQVFERAVVDLVATFLRHSVLLVAGALNAALFFLLEVVWPTPADGWERVVQLTIRIATWLMLIAIVFPKVLELLGELVGTVIVQIQRIKEVWNRKSES